MFQTEIELLKKGDARILFSIPFRSKIKQCINELLTKEVSFYNETDIVVLGELLHIGNIVYHNTDLSEEEQPIESEIYDLLLVRYQQLGYVAQVGAEPIHFDNLHTAKIEGQYDSLPLINVLQPIKNAWYDKELLNQSSSIPMSKQLFEFVGYASDKKYRAVAHENPNLVGTLDKAKFVLNKQADDKGCLNEPSTQIFERDFFMKHIEQRHINYNELIRLIMELKYDGISVVCHIKDQIVTFAYSRGDTDAGLAMDYTPILYGYRFPNLPMGIELEVKFEAVISYLDLARFNIARGQNYANPRSAIVGLFGNNDGYLYRDFITLVPLAVAGDDIPQMTRIEEIEFLNKYIATKEPLRYAYFEGTYTECLYAVKKFTEEAEYNRPIMPILYDGVVISYNDIDMREKLGRENFVNKYSIAVKFNTMKKITTLIDITYTVGQNGVITPMAHYEPVVFMGGVHTKSSISSVGRFNENQFKIGCPVELEYRNDVMPYCTCLKDLDEYHANPNPVLQFLDKCPACGEPLEFSETGKSARCVNLNCVGRAYTRMDGMMKKLELKDIAYESVLKLQKTTLHDFINISQDEAQYILGEANGLKVMRNIENLKTQPRYDFELVGALGFTELAKETWRKIFNVYSIQELIMMFTDLSMRSRLLDIKGIGPSTVDIIENEFSFYLDDILTIVHELPYKNSKGTKSVSIRCTGFRDGELMSYLRSLGYDADDNAGVTKNTAILLVPSLSHESSKIKKAMSYCIDIIPVTDFKERLDGYVQAYPPSMGCV